MPTTEVDADDGDFIRLDDADPDDVADPQKWPNERIIGAYLHQKRDSTARNTYETKRTHLRRFHAWLNERGEHVTDMTPMRIRVFVNAHADAGYRASTAEVTGRGVLDFFRTLRDDFGVDVAEYSGADPTGVTISELDATNGQSLTEEYDGKKRSYISKEEKDQLLDNAPAPATRNKIMIQLMWESGFRRSTVAETKVQDVDQERQVIEAYAPKVDKSVTTAYSDAVAAKLDLYLNMDRGANRYADTSDRLFLGREGPISPERIGMIVRDAAENAGIQEVISQDASGRDRYRVTAHKLRHGLAHHMLHKQEMDIETVRDQLGHSDISITQVYVEQEESARLDKMRESGPASRTESL